MRLEQLVVNGKFDQVLELDEDAVGVVLVLGEVEAEVQGGDDGGVEGRPDLADAVDSGLEGGDLGEGEELRLDSSRQFLQLFLIDFDEFLTTLKVGSCEVLLFLFFVESQLVLLDAVVGLLQEGHREVSVLL